MTESYTPPTMVDAVQRQRLFKLLDIHQDKQNFLITGQAAQGKTTLVATYFREASLSTIWIPLTSDDQDHAKLFDRLFHTLQRRITRDNRQKQETNTRLSNAILGTQKEVLRHVEILIQCFKDFQRPLILVLDDMENLGMKTTGFELICHLVETRFKNLKIFMLSRQVPQLNFAWLKMAKTIFILANDELSFTLSETHDFFSHKPDVSHEDIEKIHQITDGWAGGLTLVSESFRQLKNKVQLPERLTAEVFNYFSHEIYQQLETPIQQFLTQTSVLNIIDQKIIEHIFGNPDMVMVLRELENRNLFIQRVESNEESTGYKYHHLFKEFLLQNLIKTKGKNYIKTLNQRIGQFFWEERNHDAALSYFIRADAFDDIINIIKIKGTDLIIQGNFASLKKWLDCLPLDRVDLDPWLLFFHTMTARIHGGKKNIKRFQKALDLFRHTEDIRGQLLCTGYLIEAGVFVRQSSSTIMGWIQQGERLLLDLREKDRYPWARALLLQHIGLGYIAGSGDLPKGLSACKNAMIMGQQINTPGVIMNASIIMVFGFVQAGDFINAQQMLARIKKISNVVENPEYRALKSIVDINFANNCGQFERAKTLLDTSQADIETFGLIFLYPGFIEAKALQLLYTGHFDDARQMADHLRDFSILEGNNFYEGIAARIKATSFFLEEDYLEANSEIQMALESLNPLKKGDIHHYQALQIAGLIQFHQKDYIQARETLLTVQKFFNRMSFELSACETSLILGLIFWELDDRQTAFNYLYQGFEKAAKSKYTFFPLINNPDIIRAILLLTAYNEFNRLFSYGETLISKFGQSDLYDQLEIIYSQFEAKDKSKAVEHLRPLYKKMLPGLYIQALGQFSIHLGDRLLNKKSFEGAKPVMLLKAMVLHGAQEIPKEVLIDDLWPNATAKAGEKNFKINLHRLRKAIEPSPRKEFGYSYIIQKAGLVSFDPQLVQLDTDTFDLAVSKGSAFQKNNQFNQAIHQYEKACGIYKGNYFSEEPYLDWISQRRDQYRTKYMELLVKKAMLHEELDQIENAVNTWYLGLNTDPCFEIAYQNLMILFADTGQKKRAVDVFDNCKQILKNDLGTEPDPQTLDIFQQISKS